MKKIKAMGWNIYIKSIYKRVFLFVVIQLFFNAFFISAQNQYTILEGNSNMRVLSGTKVTLGGSMLLLGDSTTIDNSGDMYIKGDWINDANSPGFINQSPGTLHLAGDASQLITGAFPTEFYNLDLKGGGVKILDNAANIIDSVFLNDRELATIGNTLNVWNTNPGAFSRTTGYVSTDTTGSIAWQMHGSGQYIFPLGSNHLYKYRPVGIQSTAPDSVIMLSVGMVDNDPSLNGYDRTLTDTSLCTLNNKFYHLINYVSGNTPVSLTFFYSSTTDGNFNRAAYWKEYNNGNNQEWSGTGSYYFGTADTFKTLFTPNWNNFNLPAFALGYRGPVVQPLLSASGPLTFCDTTSVTISVFGNYQSYVWSNGGTSSNITVNTSGTYYVTVTGAGDCKGVASDVVNALNCTTGIGDVVSDRAIKVFPNPTSGLVNINMEGFENVKTEVALFNMLGERVKYATSNGESNVALYLNDLASGAYILNVSSGDRIYKEKIILAR